MITIVAANETDISTESAKPRALGRLGPPTITATPATATAIASHVRRPTRSPTSIPKTAASTGARPCRKSTFATEVWFSAAMNEPDETAISAAIARPARPIARKEATTRPALGRPTMKTPIPSIANRARPASCVPRLTVSSRWNSPAVDHAIAASAT